MQQKIKAWYFSHTKKLGYDDNRRIVAGRTHSIRFPVKHHYYRFPIEAPICCCVGLHGSIKPLHALEYKKYDISRIYVWRVELSGMMDFNYDKIAAEKRKYLWGYNATDIIKRFFDVCDNDSVVKTEGLLEKQNRRLYRMLMEGRAANV